MSQKYVNAKITHVNGGVTISWQVEDETWLAPQHYSVPEEISHDIDALKAWIQKYKDDYNVGVEIVEPPASPEVPQEVLDLVDQPLNLE